MGKTMMATRAGLQPLQRRAPTSAAQTTRLASCASLVTWRRAMHSSLARRHEQDDVHAAAKLAHETEAKQARLADVPAPAQEPAAVRLHRFGAHDRRRLLHRPVLLDDGDRRPDTADLGPRSNVCLWWRHAWVHGARLARWSFDRQPALEAQPPRRAQAHGGKGQGLL